jgi:hypothetical protein
MGGSWEIEMPGQLRLRGENIRLRAEGLAILVVENVVENALCFAVEAGSFGIRDRPVLAIRPNFVGAIALFLIFSWI